MNVDPEALSATASTSTKILGCPIVWECWASAYLRQHQWPPTGQNSSRLHWGALPRHGVAQPPAARSARHTAAPDLCRAGLAQRHDQRPASTSAPVVNTHAHAHNTTCTCMHMHMHMHMHMLYMHMHMHMHMSHVSSNQSDRPSLFDDDDADYQDSYCVICRVFGNVCVIPYDQ